MRQTFPITHPSNHDELRLLVLSSQWFVLEYAGSVYCVGTS